jgi:precorrin isomerase/sirohydrochlorin ferrochelatase
MPRGLPARGNLGAGVTDRRDGLREIRREGLHERLREGSTAPDGEARGPVVHPIEQESYRILAGRVNLSGWDPGPAAVAARVVHATADPDLVGSRVADGAAVAAGVPALRAGAPVICDVEMVRAGVSVPGAVCLLGEIHNPGARATRSAAAMAMAVDRYPAGAVVAVGCAPTALEEVNRRLAAGTFRPALVVGVPVGFVGAAEAKEQLLECAAAAGVPAIVLRGERGGAAVAAAVINALGRLADGAPPDTGAPAMLLIGHGTRSPEGQEELRDFARAVAGARPEIPVSAGFIEFMEPGLDPALNRAVDAARWVVGVPLVLLGAGHLKDDGPAALARGRRRHPGTRFSYGRDLGVHPSVLEVVAERIAEASAELPGGADAVVLVGRGSSDADANADLAKVARLLGGGHDLVEAAFVSLADPDVPAALQRCHTLGARRIAVVPYFLFTGVLLQRIGEQARAWGAGHRGTAVAMGRQMGVDRRLVELAWHRYDEAIGGPVHMNCDGCVHRIHQPSDLLHLTDSPARSPA